MALTKDHVTRLFSSLASGDAATFFQGVSPDVDWTVMGTHPLAGRYKGRENFRRCTFERLTPRLDGPVKLELVNVLVDGDTAVVELAARSTAKAGWPFDNRYCWVMEFSGGLVKRVRAYLDSAMVARLMAGD